MDPYTTTREQFTTNLCSTPIPDNASADWRFYVTNLSTLLRKLADHEAMRPNLQQMFMTPAASKNKVYFMWDFMGRTLGMLAGIPATLSVAEYSAAQREVWTDSIGRTVMGSGLILDDQPGMLDMMVPGARGGPIKFGEEIDTLARKLKSGKVA